MRTSKYFSSFIVLTLLAFCETGFGAQTVQWVQQSTANTGVADRGAAVDANGHEFVVGYFDQSATFGSVTITGEGGFLVKYDSAGNVVWAMHAGANSPAQYNTGVTTDPSGNVCVCGSCGSSAMFGSFTINNLSGSVAGVVAKANTDGTFLWATQLASTTGTSLYSVASDPSGNTYVTGSAGGVALFAPNLPINAGFVAKLDTGGNVVWAAPTGDNGNGVATDTSGNVFVTGTFAGTNSPFGNAPSQSFLASTAQGGNMFLAKFSSSGTLAWVSSPPNSFSFAGEGVPLAVGSDGSAYVTGLQYPFTSGFLVKYSTGGAQTWLRIATNGGFSSVALDSSHHVYAAGLDNYPSTINYLVQTYDESGNVLATAQYGSAAAYDWPSIAAASTGNLFLAGAFPVPVTFGTTSLTTRSNNFNLLLANVGSFAAQPPTLTMQQTPTGAAISLQGFVGNQYEIDFAPSMVGPWTPWIRFTLPVSPFTITDGSPNAPSRFYRATLILP